MLQLLGDQPSPQLLEALSAKGGVHAMQGQFPEAIEALLRAENVVKALGRPDDPSILRNLAGIFLSIGEHQRAIDYAERRHQFATCVHGDGELATRHFANFLSESFGSTKNGVQSFWKA